MAISLNNHESRIKALENKSDELSIVELMTKAKYLSSTLTTFATLPSNVNMLIFMIGLGGPTSVAYAATSSVLVRSVTNIEHGIYFNEAGDGNQSTVTCKIEGTAIKLRKVYNGSGTNDDCIKYIYGLKLYYSFSYNIIYKILRSKISRLYQIFTLLKQKECEIKWL